MKLFRVVQSGEGYQNLPWWPVVAGGIGYYKDGGAICYADLVIFRRFYVRLFEAQIAPFSEALWNPKYSRIGREMYAATPNRDDVERV